MTKSILKWIEVYSKVPSSVWVDCWCLVALIKFIMDKHIDTGTFSVVLGFYAGSKTVQSFSNSNVPQGPTNVK